MSEKPISVDWRHRSVAQGELPSHDPDTGGIGRNATMTADTLVKYNGRGIRFGDPSASALFLSQSHKAYTQALKIHPFLHELTTWEDIQELGYDDPTTLIFDYLEHISASIVFACTAIEAYTNERIPEDFKYQVDETTESGLTIVRLKDKETIERHSQLDEKLATILPQALGIRSPKGLAIWANYKKLRQLRDRIIHSKSADRRRSNTNNLYPDSLWKALLDPKQLNYPTVAKAMITHFEDKDAHYWLKHCPF